MEQPPFAARRVPSPARQAVGRVVAAHEVVSTILWNEGSKIGRLRGRSCCGKRISRNSRLEETKKNGKRTFAQIANVTVGVEEEETKRRVSKRGDRISCTAAAARPKLSPSVSATRDQAAGEEAGGCTDVCAPLGSYVCVAKSREQQGKSPRRASRCSSVAGLWENTHLGRRSDVSGSKGTGQRTRRCPTGLSGSRSIM